MASSKSKSFGASNSGKQVTHNVGTVKNGLGRYQVEPSHFSTVPFARDLQFIDRRALFAQLQLKGSAPATIALLGGSRSGKSHLAIEYCYRIRDQSPGTWVFWIDASNAARFEQGYREIAARAWVPGTKDPDANVCQLVIEWLQRGNLEKFILIVDGLDDNLLLERPSLLKFLPQKSSYGFIIVTTRSRNMALMVAEESDIISIKPMNMSPKKAAMRKGESKGSSQAPGVIASGFANSRLQDGIEKKKYSHVVAVGPNKSTPSRERIRQHMEKMKMDSKIDFNPRCTEHVGHGGFAQVFKEPGALIGIRKPWVAVKRILKGHSNAPFAIEKDEIVREIVTAADLMKEQSDLFVEFFGWSEDDNFVFLAMEYVELGDLKANSHSPWAEHDTKLIMHQLLEGLVKMHRENIAHRDLKPQNILLISRDPPRVKIGDFGISKRVPKDSSTRYDTRYSSGGYCAPEITKGKAKEQYTKAVDLWSLGCIMYEMVVGERLFRDDVHAAYEYGDIISGLESTMSRKFSEYGMSLLMSLIANNPAERPNAEEALSHIWFR